MTTELSDEELARRIVSLIKEQVVESGVPEDQNDPGLDEVSKLIEERLTKPGFLSELVHQANEAGFKLKAEDVAAAFLDAVKIRSRLH